MMIRKIESRQDLERAFPLLRELRTDLPLEAFLSLYGEAHAREQYRLVGLLDGESWVALMGYRILHDFVHGRHLYVDDLVVTARLRSRGLGARLLEFAEDEARRLGCGVLRLCTGVDNAGARRFYERGGWSPRSVAFKKRIGKEIPSSTPPS